MGIEKYFETSLTPHLNIEQIHGNMQLRAWDESRIMISGKGDAYRFKQEGDEIWLGDFDDCRIFVPTAASVTLGEVHGNVLLAGVRGQTVVQKIHGNLRGEELGEVNLGRVDGEFSVRDVAGALMLGHVGGNINASEVKGNLQAEHSGGNCTLREVEGEITLGRVRGNLNAHETGTLTVENVSGNLNVKELNGNVQANKVGGNVSAVETLGDINVEWAGGEIKVREVMGGLNARVGGNAHLNLHELSIPFVTVHAGGEIRCFVPLTLDAQVDLRAGTEVIIKGLPLPDQWDARHVEYTVGSGEGRLTLDAGHRIKLLGADEHVNVPEWGVEVDVQFQNDFGERTSELVQQVADQVEAQVEAFTRQLNERLAQLDSGDALANKVQQKVQSAMRRAEEKIAEAMQHAERQAGRQAERYAAREDRRRVRVMPPIPPMPPMGGMAAGIHHVHMAPPPPPAPAPKPKRNPPTAEERMLVLRMLEEGKISVDQAEKLLSAMGGE